MSRQNIDIIQANDEVRDIYLVAAASMQQSRNGPYWRVELRDATGSVEAKIWSPLSQNFSEIPSGTFVRIEARASLYRDQLQLTIDTMHILEADASAALDISQFMPSSPRPAEDMLSDIEALCRKELKHKAWRKFAQAVLKEPDIRSRLLLAPAAKSVHHAYCGGLLEHMLSVAGICMHIADHYGQELDRQLLLCGALFHDIGKLEEMSGGLVNEYTDAGQLIGHIVQGSLMLEPYLHKSGLGEELVLHFRHLLVSHHGEREYGSPTLPATAEAFVLHYADNIDAKVAQLRSLLPSSRNMQEGGPEAEMAAPVWSGWNNLLGRRLARLPRTPQDSPPAGKSSDAKPQGSITPQDKDDRQCSLL